jgi:SAM-dependent methyltransferase
MPEVDENLRAWTQWDWSQQGDEWSAFWGGTPAMWFGALLPRIHAFVPTGTILEIAPGYGRWTQYLHRLAERLVVVDLMEGCIEHCRKRFEESTNIEYHVNDGRSLDMVENESVDFAFSFDSLVHAESDVIRAYLEQLARKLRSDGVGFIHHSNVGSYRTLASLARRAPSRIVGPLTRRGLLITNPAPAWRSESVTADSFARQCQDVGMACVAQEKISWLLGGRYLIDSLSVFTPSGSRWDRPRIVISNPRFTEEARRMARLYSRESFTGTANPAH